MHTKTRAQMCYVVESLPSLHPWATVTKGFSIYMDEFISDPNIQLREMGGLAAIFCNIEIGRAILFKNADSLPLPTSVSLSQILEPWLMRTLLKKCLTTPYRMVCFQEIRTTADCSWFPCNWSVRMSQLFLMFTRPQPPWTHHSPRVRELSLFIVPKHKGMLLDNLSVTRLSSIKERKL